MSRVWLASYPKSGNTWLRVLLANLGREEAIELASLRQFGANAGGRTRIDELYMFATGLLSHAETDRLRPAFYRHLALLDEDDAPGLVLGTRFLKTHDAWTLTDRGEPLLGGAEAARAAVLIVRDPRDVVASLANHNGKPIDDTITLMADRNSALARAVDRQPLQLRQQLLGWSHFAASWLDQRELPVHLVRYEDLLEDTAGTLERLLAALGLPVEPDQIERAAALSSFRSLQEQEARAGFREAPVRMSEGRFFRKGRAGGWREELSTAQRERIEADHGAMMRRFGYLA